MARCLREVAAMTGEVRENPVAAFLMQPVQLVLKEILEIHHFLQCPVAFLDSKRPGVNLGMLGICQLRQKAPEALRVQ
jgi:hypothetical protein